MLTIHGRTASILVVSPSRNDVVMYTIWIKYIERLRASYWFIPSLLVVTAAVASFVTVYVDLRLGADWLERVSWLEANKPEGARALLSAVATSSITVAGVVFSITIASVSLASQQFGPRLLTNFMRDRSNQFVLGTFLATFIYSILVLRTIHDIEEDYFVPHVSIGAALLLTLLSVGVLIFFIHHISDSLRATTVMARIGNEIEEVLETMFPDKFGHDPQAFAGADGEQDLPEGFDTDAVVIASSQTGYVQGIDGAEIMALARKDDLVLCLTHRPGEFVFEGEPLACVWPPERLKPRAARKLNRFIVTDRQRSPRQDVLFLVNELVEMAARALSTGVNDPFTAINCIDRLAAACTIVLGKDIPSPYRYDDDGRLRVVVSPISFESFAEAAFGQLRPYATRDRNVARHFLTMLAELIEHARCEEHRAVLIEHGELAREAAIETLNRREDRNMLDELMGKLLKRAAEARHGSARPSQA